MTPKSRKIVPTPDRIRHEVILWRTRAGSDCQRLNLVTQQLLQQSDRCEAALQQTHMELASLKADASLDGVYAAIATLQKTIDQAKAIQDELRKQAF